MKTQLQRIRKDRGFKSAKAFAEHIGMSKDTYTNYEQGARPITLELAWEFADVLGCTLDELAGRDFKADSYADPRQAVMKNYEQGARPITLELAWEFADVLGCTLDELAGRDFKADSYADPRQAVMNDDYARLSDAGKDAAAGAVRGIRASEGARVGAAGLEDHQIAASA